MKHYWTLFLISFLLGGYCTAQTQKLSVLERNVANSSAIENDVISLAYNNPAMKALWHTSTLTKIYVGGEYQKEDLAKIIQEGDGRRFGNIDVSSFIRKKNYSLWGQATYKNGKQLGRCWNETSDYSLLYPYVMGDTLGGDLKSEQYFFSGGYAYTAPRYVIGVEGSYKAGIEYRNADPRPKNLTGDLKARFGGAYSLNKTYLLGASIFARKYKQTNDLAFYNELGVPVIYHFTGLGTDYYRFRGAKGESFYKGHSFGTSIDFLPSTVSGASASLLYNNFQFDKVISSLNELPMAKVKENQFKGEMAWKQLGSNNHHWGGRGSFNYTRRVGTENIFDVATGNIFTQIGSQDKYMNKIYEGQVAGVYEYTANSKLRIAALPAISYTDIHTTYLNPLREMKASLLSSKVDFRITYPYRKWLFNGEVGYFNRFSTQHNLDAHQGLKANEEKLQEPLLSNYGALKTTYNGVHTQLKADYSWNDKYGIYLALHYQYTKDHRESVGQRVEGRIGFEF